MNAQFLTDLYLQKIDPQPKSEDDIVIDKSFSNYLEDNKITYKVNDIVISDWHGKEKTNA